MLSIKKFIIKISIFIIFFALFYHPHSVLAEQSTYLNNSELSSFNFTNYESINPNLLIYPLKRLAEEIKLNLIFNQQKKKEYIYNLYEIRLNELLYIVNNKKEGFIVFTADRYNSFVGKIKKGYPPDAKLKSRFQNHVKLLERLRDIYPARSLYWDKLQQTIDTTKTLI